MMREVVTVDDDARHSFKLKVVNCEVSRTSANPGQELEVPPAQRCLLLNRSESTTTRSKHHRVYGVSNGPKAQVRAARDRRPDTALADAASRHRSGTS